MTDKIMDPEYLKARLISLNHKIMDIREKIELKEALLPQLRAKLDYADKHEDAKVWYHAGEDLRREQRKIKALRESLILTMQDRNKVEEVLYGPKRRNRA